MADFDRAYKAKVKKITCLRSDINIRRRFVKQQQGLKEVRSAIKIRHACSANPESVRNAVMQYIHSKSMASISPSSVSVGEGFITAIVMACKESTKEMVFQPGQEVLHLC